MSSGVVQPGDFRRLLNTRTESQSYELRGTIVPLESRQTSLSLTAELNLRDENQSDHDGEIYRDHVRTLSVSANYKLQDQVDGWNYLNASLRQGLDGLGASASGALTTSRPGAGPDFSVFGFAYSRYQSISEDWSIKGTVSGQFASQPLFNSQAFYLGGASFGPGYYSGDHGISGSFELRFDQTIDLDWLASYQLYGIVEGGQVWNIGGGSSSLASVGLGIRMRWADDWSTSVALAVPISYSSRTTEFSDYRILFSLSHAFKLCPDEERLRCL